MPTLRIPLVGSLINRNDNPSGGAFLTKDQYFSNFYPEVVKNQITGSGSAYLYKRPSFNPASPAGTSVGSFGHLVWTGKADGTSPVILTYNASTVVKVYNNTTQVGGDLATTAECLGMSETIISGVSNLFGIFSDSGTGLFEGWFFPEGGAWTFINDGDFPPNLGTPEPLAIGAAPCTLDGYLFWLTKKGNLWNSDLNSMSAYTANSFTPACTPDSGVGIARYKNMIVAFGTGGIRYFQNTGNATGSPLTVIQSAQTRVGAQASSATCAPCIYSNFDTVYFIGNDIDSGVRGVYRLNGYVPEKISNPFIDKLLNDASFGIVGIAGIANFHGMRHLILYLGPNATTYAYCIDTNSWWVYTEASNIIPCAINGIGGVSIYASRSTGSVYTGSQTAYVSQAQLQTENMDFGSMKRKYFERIRPYGFDVQSGTSTLTIEYSDDDFATYTTWGTIDLSSAAAINRGLTRGGSGRRRAFRLTHASNTPMRGQGIEVDYVVGNS